MSSRELIEYAHSFYATFNGDDRGAMEDMLDPAFRFSSPADPDLDLDGFFSRCWPHRHLLRDMHIDTAVANGDEEVFVRYAATGNQGPFHNMERLRILNGRLVEAEVFWGPPAGAFGER
jgi:hypothetical protein